MAEESAQIAACLAHPDGLNVATSLMDQAIAIDADIVRSDCANPWEIEHWAARESIRSRMPRAGGPTESEFPGLSQPRLELREQPDEIRGLQVILKVLIVPVLETALLRARTGSRGGVVEALGRDQRDPVLALDRPDPLQSPLLASHAFLANSDTISKNASLDQGRLMVGGFVTNCQPASVRTMRK